MLSTAAALHLRLYGEVRWIASEVETTINGRLAEVVAILAHQQPEWVSADVFIDRLWGQPPKSGHNAVQRLVARVRRQLDDLDLDATHVIESSHAGYRLDHHVTTDLRLPDSALVVHPPDGFPPWWEPPLGNIDLDRARTVRRTLDLRAASQLRRWVDNVVDCTVDGMHHGGVEAALSWLLDRAHLWEQDPDVGELALLLASASSDAALRRRAAERVLETVDVVDEVTRTMARMMLPAPVARADFGCLSECSAAVQNGDGDAAQRALDGLGATVAKDVGTRAEIWLSLAPASDGFTQANWRDVTGCAGVLLPIAEQGAVTLDAFALEHTDHALESAEAALATARSLDETVRALRVRFMVGLGFPVDARQIEVVQQLFAIEHPDARVEAPRFAAILAVKQLQPTRAVELLERAGEEAARQWPDSIDDHAALYRTVMHTVWSDVSTTESVTPLATNVDTLLLAQLVERLISSRVWTEVENAQLEGWRLRAHDCTRAECAQALDLLTAHTRGDRRAAARLASEMTPVWLSWPPNRHRHAGIVATGLHAEAVGDHGLASAAAEALEPWRGEMLGIWPMDALFGRAHEWIERLSAV